MNADLSLLLVRIADSGAVKDRSHNGGKGYLLKHHEKEPDAPLAPIFFNLRTADNPKPGPLTPEIVDAIGAAMFELAEDSGLDYDYVCGIPNAGEPFAAGFAKAAAARGKKVTLVHMSKKSDGDKRWIDSITSEVKAGKTLLLIDDLITKAHSKLEAIAVALASGLIVKDVVVFLDREQGGWNQLAEAGYMLWSVVLVRNFLKVLLDTGKMTPEHFTEAMEYLFPSSK